MTAQKKWIAARAILGASLALSTATLTTAAADAAPPKAKKAKPATSAPASDQPTIDVDKLPDAAPAAAPPRPKKDATPAPVTTPPTPPPVAAAAAPKTEVAAASAPVPAPAKARTGQDDDDVEPRPLDTPPTPTPQPTPTAPPNVKGEGGENLAVTAPPMESQNDDGKLEVRPYLLVSGGVKGDIVKSRSNESRQDRVSTFALGRLGLRAKWLDFVSAESELMASGGVSMHGTSAYEGQAAMQVRQQIVRLTKGPVKLEVGRVIDEASVDFFSAHVAESFLQDTATRDALLFSGYNLGNGIRGTYEIIPGLRAGLTFNAANPVSSTSSLMVGGSFPPFERFYTQPYQAVNQGPNHFPDDTFHAMVLTPAVLVDTKMVDAKLAIQGFDIDTNMNTPDNDHIRGYNVRGNVRLKLADGLLVPFINGAYTRNDTLVANNLAKRASERYQAVNLGGGVDVDIQRRFKCSYDCADGLGAQYQQVQYQVGDGIVTTQRFVNVGATYWLAPNVSLGARFAMWMNEVEYTAAVGERSVIAALRFIMP